ncbi:MAG: glycosyltransferase family 1 protein [Candidatus Promineifilaceae bacterium]|nr:glycosyltransferase family 1 protein [Candidatus Promineifilaceae bacterium]
MALNAYFWNRPDTGSGQYLRQLVYFLNRLVSDLEITLIYPHAGEPDDVPPSVNVHRVRSRPGHLGKILFEQVTFSRACRAVGATVAHVPYWGPPLQASCPLVVTVHDLITLRQREYRRGVGPRLYNALVSAGAREADRVITDSRFSQREIVEHLGIPESRIKAIHLAPAPQYSADDDLLMDMAVQQKYDLPDFYVLYLGGYALHKNVTTLLQAYTYVAQAMGEDYPLVLAGKKPAPSFRFPDYDDVVRRAHLQQHVRWIGYVEEEDKPAIYRGALCFAFPSRYEGFGLPPLEAMACGTPVVTSDAASLPEVVGDAAFAVEPDDERHMGGAIISLLIQEEFAREMSQKGLERAADFSWERTATETLLVYDEVAST